MRRGRVILVGGLALGAAAVPLIAQDQMSPEEQRDWFVQLVEGQLSTPDRQIRISNIDGILSSRASIRRITFSDAEGVWLSIDNSSIDWDQGALFGGRLLVRELTAESVTFSRQAVSSGERALPAPESGGFSVPEFPVAIQLDKLSIPKVTFGAGVFGLGSEVAIDGSLKLEGGALDSALEITRLDGPGGRLNAEVGYDNAADSVDLKVTLTEPQNGILANLLNIEGRPEIALGIAGAGPVNDLRTTLTLDAGGVRALQGVATVAEAPGGLAVDAELAGPVGTLVAPQYRPFFGAETAVKASALVRNAGGFDVSGLSVTGGQLALSGNLATTADGFLSALDIDAVVADPSGAAVLLPVPGGNTSLGRATLGVDFGGSAGETWTATLAAENFDNGSLEARSLTLDASGVASDLTDAAKRRLTFNVDGQLAGISSADREVSAALGDSMGFGMAGLWNAGEPIQLAEMRLVGKALTLALAGKIDGTEFDGKIDVATQSLAPFSDLAGRRLSGALALAATGTLSPLSGGFDLTLDGDAKGLSLAEPALDRLLRDDVALSGRVARTDEGLIARDFRLGNANVMITADGSFATGNADFGFAASLSDLGMVADNSSGRLEVTGSARGRGDIALQLTGRVPQGRLAGKTLRDAAFGFDGRLSEENALAGRLSGNTSLGGVGVTLAGDVSSDDTGRKLTGLRFAAGATLLEGDVSQTSDGLATGRLRLNSTDISTAAALAAIEATGSASADIMLTGEGGRQGARITGQIGNLRADAVRVQSADIDAALSDLLGTPAVDGRVTARAITAGGFTVDRVDAEATQTGAVTNFTVNAALETDTVLANAGLAPLTATARGNLSGRMVTLTSLAAQGREGLTITGSGRVPLEGEGVAIDISGSAPLGIGNRFVADRGGQLSGTARLSARVEGSLSAPRFSGSVTTEGAGYVDPELNLRLIDIGGSAILSGERVVIDRLTARLSTGGTVSASGSVGISGRNSADLGIRLNQARYADGTLFVATVSGDLRLTGELAANALVSGDVRIERADITVPDSFGGAAALVDATHRNIGRAAKATLERARIDARGPASGGTGSSSSVALDVNVAAPNQIFVRGRGLDAEVGGSVRLTGTVNNIQPVGGFTLSRGRLALLGQRITFEEGMVTLVGDLDPYLDFRARTDGNGITVFVDVTGRASELDIGFSSNPALPQDEVLSRLLFGRSMGELTPLQLARLAGAAAELAGGGGGNSLVDSLRERAGLSDLDVVTGADGNVAVQAGTYLQENIYLGVSAGADGNSRVTVNLDLTDDIRARASTGTNGDTSLGIFFERDY